MGTRSRLLGGLGKLLKLGGLVGGGLVASDWRPEVPASLPPLPSSGDHPEVHVVPLRNDHTFNLASAIRGMLNLPTTQSMQISKLALDNPHALLTNVGFSEGGMSARMGSHGRSLLEAQAREVKLSDEEVAHAKLLASMVNEGNPFPVFMPVQPFLDRAARAKAQNDAELTRQRESAMQRMYYITGGSPMTPSGSKGSDLRLPKDPIPMIPTLTSLLHGRSPTERVLTPTPKLWEHDRALYDDAMRQQLISHVLNTPFTHMIVTRGTGLTSTYSEASKVAQADAEALKKKLQVPVAYVPPK